MNIPCKSEYIFCLLLDKPIDISNKQLIKEIVDLKCVLLVFMYAHFFISDRRILRFPNRIVNLIFAFSFIHFA